MPRACAVRKARWNRASSLPCSTRRQVRDLHVRGQDFLEFLDGRLELPAMRAAVREHFQYLDLAGGTLVRCACGNTL
jgi:hypothetical protein